MQFCFMSKNKGHIHYIYQYSSAYLIPKQSQRFFQPLALLWAPTPTHSTTHTRWHLSLTLEPPSCKICLVCSWLVLGGISGWEQRSNLSWNDYNCVAYNYMYIYILYIIYMIHCVLLENYSENMLSCFFQTPRCFSKISSEAMDLQVTFHYEAS